MAADRDRDRTTVQTVALVYGVIFLLVGIVGLLMPGGREMDVTDPAMLLGMFPVNLLHNVIHALFGVWGLVAARSWAGAKTYCQVAGVVYLLLVLLAFVDPTTFGLVPIGGNDVWLHALLAVPLLYFGFTSREPARARV